MISRILTPAAMLFACVSTSLAQTSPAELSPTQYEEYLADTRRVYLLWDIDGDGIVMAEEFLDHPDFGVAQPVEDENQRARDVSSYLKKDLDQDGVVTAEEFGADMYKRKLSDFMSLDVNADGLLSFVEVIHPQEGAEAAIMGGVSGTSFRYGATNEEVNAPHPFLHKGAFDANYSAYIGHAFARWDKDESFTLSLAEFAGVSDGESGS